MLYPNFEELIQLKEKAFNFKLMPNNINAAITGNYLSPFRGQGLEFQEVREYIPGDDTRKIDWHVTARTGKPHIKMFVEERERSVLICVDQNTSMNFGTRVTFKSVQAARAASLIGWCAHLNDDKVGACLFGDENIKFLTPKRSRKSLLEMLKLLSSKSSDNNKAYLKIEDMLKSLKNLTPTGALIFIISDFNYLEGESGDELERQLAYLSKRSDIILVTVDDPADKAIAGVGNILFSNDTNSILINTNDEEGRGAYSKLWEENREKLNSIASRLRLGIISLVTNQDIYFDLLYGLKFIGKQRRR